MTHQQIIDLIRDTANTVNAGGGFVYGTRFDGSIHSVSTGADGVTPGFPLIHLYSSSKSVDRNNDNHKWSLVVAFWYQDDLQNVPGQTDTAREEILANAETLCDSFMEELSGSMIMIENENQTPEVLQLAGTVSGWSCSFDIISKDDC